MADTPESNDPMALLHQTMADALARVDAEKEKLVEEQSKLSKLQEEARDELKRIEREAHEISTAYMDQNRKKIKDEIREEILLDTTKKLIMAGIPSFNVKSILGITAKVLADAWDVLGFDKLSENHVGHVAYEQEGRAGKVIFYREDIMLRFYFEFGGNNTIAIIFIPEEKDWEAQTKLPLADRMPILEFVAKRCVRDQAPHGRYEIQADSILIIDKG